MKWTNKCFTQVCWITDPVYSNCGDGWGT